MIISIGIDLVEIERIRRAMANPRFAERILSSREKVETMSPAKMAGRWAAKEAIVKCWPQVLRWQDIEITSGESGAPQPKILAPTDEIGKYQLHLSITHERTHAAAFAVLECFDQ